MRRFHDLLRGWYAYAKGWRTYFVIALISLPDILDAIGAMDLSPILPAEWPSAKIMAWFAIARVVLGIYIRRLPAPNVDEGK